MKTLKIFLSPAREAAVYAGLSNSKNLPYPIFYPIHIFILKKEKAEDFGNLRTGLFFCLFILPENISELES